MRAEGDGKEGQNVNVQRRNAGAVWLLLAARLQRASRLEPRLCHSVASVPWGHVCPSLQD